MKEGRTFAPPPWTSAPPDMCPPGHVPPGLVTIPDNRPAGDGNEGEERTRGGSRGEREGRKEKGRGKRGEKGEGVKNEGGIAP